MLVDHTVVHRRFVERGQVLALEVFDDGDLQRRVVVDLFDECGDGCQAGEARRAPPSFAGDDLILVGADGAHEDRLEHTVLADGSRQFFEGVLFEDDPRLLRIRIDPIHRHDPDTDATGRTVRREQTDDRRGQLGVLG